MGINGYSKDFEPCYRKLLARGELENRVKAAREILADCTLCPHHCHVDRTAEERGECGLGSEIFISSYGPHRGEEAPLAGTEGSGTIFFSSCNLFCVFCQNYDISQKGRGRQISTAELAEIMLELQEKGCHNINFVTPSHMIHALLEGVYRAASKGLEIPIVYNSGGYDNLESLQLLEGVVDIYLPDFKYGDSETGKKYSGIPDYFKIAGRAVKEMYRQVGDLQTENGLATRGLMVRHLVLPEELAGTEKVIKFLAREVSSETYVNVMDQYYPAYRAREHPPLDRRTNRDEYRQAIKQAREFLNSK